MSYIKHSLNMRKLKYTTAQKELRELLTAKEDWEIPSVTSMKTIRELKSFINFTNILGLLIGFLIGLLF